ncbi:MAG: hypothetical protein M1837_000774 [Sclerophora amabilis]|nr:MAG: hypothetical protein M1837_000774 [Sclerophora amabilis]
MFNTTEKLRKLPFSNSALPIRVVVSYVLDYVILVVLLAIFTAIDALEPFHQHFSLRNYTLQYPYAEKERVPVPLAFFLCIVCPTIVIAVYTLVVDGIFSHQQPHDAPAKGPKFINRTYKLKDRLWELNCGILGILLSVGFTLVITQSLKTVTGKPRPDLIDRCRPKEGSEDAPVFGLSDSSICEQTEHSILKDGFRSFPSGHASTAFAGLFYLSLYLAGKLHVFDNRGEVWKLFIVLLPSLGASLIADSRIMDARHHPFDVITGGLIGIAVAWCAYRQYFPPLGETWRKGRAYPIRTWAREPKRPREEEGDDRAVQPSDAEPLRDFSTRYEGVDEEQPRPYYEPPPSFPRSPGHTFPRDQGSPSQSRGGEQSHQPYMSSAGPIRRNTEEFPSPVGRPYDNVDDDYLSYSGQHDNSYGLQPREIP